jgi:tyrosinase
LTKETTFDGFCTAAAAGLAIENIHDNIHGDIGGGAGHMSFLTYSAFDPIL